MDTRVENVARHECAPENASRMRDWIATRGGVAIWASVNLSNASASWSTPALTEGAPTTRPNWQADVKPVRIITDASEIEVITRREVKRFHVAIRVGGGGYKLTDGATRRVRAEVEKAGKDAIYEFDYSSQEACILVPAERVLLSEWTPATIPLSKESL